MRALLFLAGAALCTLLAANMAYNLYLVRGEYIFAVRLPSALFWGDLFMVLAVACVLGAAMKPKEFNTAITPEEPKPAAWIEEMRAQAQSQDRKD